jgi:hypothetical protein
LKLETKLETGNLVFGPFGLISLFQPTTAMENAPAAVHRRMPLKFGKRTPDKESP